MNTFTEVQLASFGNYLFKRYGVMEYSNDGTNTPLFGRQVCDADVSNWLHDEQQKPNTVTPSEFQKGDKVLFCCMPEGLDDTSFPGISAEVLAVHFYGQKVKYDLDLLFVDNQRSRIYNIDSVLVVPRP